MSTCISFGSVPETSLVVQDLAASRTIFRHCERSSVALTASTNDGPVHVLMLSCQVMRGHPRTLVPDMVPSTTTGNYTEIGP